MVCVKIDIMDIAKLKLKYLKIQALELKQNKKIENIYFSIYFTFSQPFLFCMLNIVEGSLLG